MLFISLINEDINQGSFNLIHEKLGTCMCIMCIMFLFIYFHARPVIPIVDCFFFSTKRCSSCFFFSSPNVEKLSMWRRWSSWITKQQNNTDKHSFVELWDYFPSWMQFVALSVIIYLWCLLHPLLSLQSLWFHWLLGLWLIKWLGSWITELSCVSVVISDVLKLLDSKLVNTHSDVEVL